VQVSRDAFESLVADALDEIPPALAAEMDNVAVVVEEWPTAAQLAGRSGTLLGLYEGVPLTKRDPVSYAGVAPDRITIFQGTISQRAGTPAELAAQVRVTVLHEVGHHFGMSDERLHELGWA
jgi:predicted Zn-dependent protease with MMP-like domain